MRTLKPNFLDSENFSLSKLFVFEGFKFSKAAIKDGCIFVYLRRKTKTGQCPKCGKERRKPIEFHERRIRDLDISGIECYIVLDTYRIGCNCGFRGMEKLEFINTYSRYTKRFEECVAILCQKMTIKDVSKEMRITWEAAKNIDKREAKKYIVNLAEVCPKVIGMDEIAYEKGHKYITVVRDVELGKVIWTGIGRSKETLDKFFQELGKERSKGILKAVLDMWDPYIASVKENTKAEIVFDKFHIAKKINEALDKIRKKKFANAEPDEKKRMKKKRFVILARNENLQDDKREELKTLMKKNEELYKAYLLKEHALNIMDDKRYKIALQRFGKWFRNVRNSGFEEFEEVVKTMKRYMYGIKNYFKYGLTNAGGEGFNTKINVIKRRAYGFRDMEYFRLKIIQLCGPICP